MDRTRRNLLIGGAAVGAKLAAPDATVLAVTGDGSYLFSVPSSVHWMAARYRTPFVQVVLAALTCEASLTISLSPDRDDLDWLAELSTVMVMAEDDLSLITRLNAGDVVYDRLRALGPLSTALRRALNEMGISVIDAPVLANGRLELRYYLREQALSQTIHRYGNIMKTYRQS